VSASADQINWVLTSYIVAAAIMTRHRASCKQVRPQARPDDAVVGFVIASVLCGIAQSLVQIVAFRLLQGFFGAALVRLASLSARHLTVEERGSRCRIRVSVMVGPVRGR